MKVGTRLFLVVLIAAAGIWLWTIFFPSPDRVIRKRLAAVAQAASFTPGRSYFANVAGAQHLADYFATNVVVRIDLPGHEPQALSGREDIFQTALGARATLKSLSITFPDITLIINPDKQSAVADLTAQAATSTDPDMFVQEMKFTWKKIGGQWLIIRLETVQTLQRGN